MYERLLQWKNNEAPDTAILIDGARRVGKSYVAEHFAKAEYKSYILIDFNIAPREVRAIFDENLDNLDEFFEECRAGKHLAGVEAFVTLKKGFVDKDGPVGNGLRRVEGVAGTRGNPDALGFVGKEVQLRGLDNGAARKQDHKLRPRGMLVPRGPVPFVQSSVEREQKFILVEKVFVPVTRIPILLA
jgi:hypothetical protein